MSSVRDFFRGIGDTWDGLPPMARRGIGVVALVLLILLPFAFTAGGSFIDNATRALAYSVMALGLNIVVGFAGLLDLGYVAFYALGAFTIGWFGSSFYAQVDHGKGIHVGVTGVVGTLPGIHMNFLLVLVLAVISVGLTMLADLLNAALDPRLRGA